MTREKHRTPTRLLPSPMTRISAYRRRAGSDLSARESSAGRGDAVGGVAVQTAFVRLTGSVKPTATPPMQPFVLGSGRGDDQYF